MTQVLRQLAGKKRLRATDPLLPTRPLGPVAGTSESTPSTPPILLCMSWSKRAYEEQQERGWKSSEQNVCRDCVDDEALAQALAQDEGPNLICDFCHRSPATPMNTLLRVFVKGMKNVYGLADNEGIFYDSREGGYQANVLDSSEIVEEFYDVLTGDGLLEAVQDCMIENTWVELNFAWRRRDTVLSEGWSAFCDLVKNRNRYFFWVQDDDDAAEEAQSTGEILPSMMLETIGEHFEYLPGLVTQLPAGTGIWRARECASSAGIEPRASNLGTVPDEYATQANRMSPAGIPMFYGSSDPETALREINVRAKNEWGTVGQFELSRASTIIDFTRLPKPNMFDERYGPYWQELGFLQEFAANLSEPARETHEQIDYVPTQIVTEYFFHVLKTEKRVDGLIYRSAQTGSPCAVLNVKNSGCIQRDTEYEAPSSASYLFLIQSARDASIRKADPSWRSAPDTIRQMQTSDS